MTGELPNLGYYALYRPDSGFAEIFQLPPGEQLANEMLAKPWWIVPLGLTNAAPLPGLEPEPERPAVEPPISIVNELPTNNRAAWPFPQLKAKDPAPPRLPGDIKHITIHHSAGQRATTNIRYWHRLHTESKSWSRCGYHLGIGALEAGGPTKLYEINPLQYVSWHDTRNYDTYAVTFAGDLRTGHDIEPNDTQLECFGRAVAFLLPQLPNLESVIGHRFWQATDCPGDLDRWYVLLVDAAKQYGHDIGGLLNLKPPAMSRLARALTTRRYGPPPADYEGV